MSDEKKLTVFLLCYFFGMFGGHRFYTGKTKSGIFMALTLGGFFVLYVNDLVTIITGGFTDKEGRKITAWV
ncbi:MAG: TM2 domain-containing protein [Pyrinomonadaceae bacterium]|nr:TM2 domain-containing protein [Pyrinomonadaceae bacterium]